MDIKAILHKNGIPYWERGVNTPRDQISVTCPWCGSQDKSHHLAINPVSLEYYCFRNPKHSGHSVQWLFKALHLPYDATYYKANLREEPSSKGIGTVASDSKDYTAFRYFRNAYESEKALTYLSSRLFSQPVEVCKQFNLKVADEGEWAGRLVIPLTEGWTARSMSPHIRLRYKAFTSENGFFLFQHHSSSVIVLEGALDCMRIASCCTQFDVVGKCRSVISPAILMYLREVGYLSVYNCPDGTVPFSQCRQETEELRSYLPKSDVKGLKMPADVKDFGEMTEGNARQMLSMIG